jgi:uncharacterized protein YceH (UPF0502 family)
MCEFDDIAEVDGELERLGGLPEPVVARLARRPGQKEERWAQLLTDGSTGLHGQPADDVPSGGATPAPAPEPAELRVEVAELKVEVAQLRVEVAELRERVAQLCDDVEALRRGLDRPPERPGT